MSLQRPLSRFFHYSYKKFSEASLLGEARVLLNPDHGDFPFFIYNQRTYFYLDALVDIKRFIKSPDDLYEFLNTSEVISLSDYKSLKDNIRST